jgi:serine/threonine protein kinase
MRFIRGDSLKEAIADLYCGDESRDVSDFEPDPTGTRNRVHRVRPGRDSGHHSLALRKILRRFLDVCNAVGYAHSRGVLHRDIKPGNIILGQHGETLVVDWGHAKPTGQAAPGIAIGEHAIVPVSASGSVETLPGSALGTPAYMSPEQAAGDLN